MKLTNNLSKPNFDDSADLSLYFMPSARQQLLNNSVSDNNETLLLETTEIYQNSKNNGSRKNITNQQIDKKMISYYQSSLGELCSQLEITVSHDQQNQHEDTIKSRNSDLYNICRNLISTLKNLQAKFNKIQGRKGSKLRKLDQKQSFFAQSQQQKEVQSTLTFSSLKNSKGCQCDKEFVSSLYGFVQLESKIEIYKQQNEDLKKQVIKLEVNIQEMKKTIKKAEGENIKLKELLKQYQNFNRKQATERKIFETQGYSNVQLHSILSERKLNPVKSNIFEKVDEDLEAYISRSDSEHNFQSERHSDEHIKDFYQYIISEEQTNCFNHKKLPLTPSLIPTKPNMMNESQQKSNSKPINSNMNVQKCVSFKMKNKQCEYYEQNQQNLFQQQSKDLHTLKKMEKWKSENKQQNPLHQSKNQGKALCEIKQTQQKRYVDKENKVPFPHYVLTPSSRQISTKKFNQIKNIKQMDSLSKVASQLFEPQVGRKRINLQ